MSASAIHEVEFALPSSHLDRANWADAYEVISPRPDLGALAAAKLAFGAKPPGWMQGLMKLRNALTGLIGLKAAEMSVDQETVGAFPIISESAESVVLGFDDWHLDFRIVVETQAHADGTLVRVATLVNRKHWFGYIYIFLITPFHRLIAKRLMGSFLKEG